MQAMLFSATAAVSVLTKTPFDRVSRTSETIVAGAVAIETAPKSIASSKGAPPSQYVAPNTSSGVIVDSAIRR